MPLPSLTGPFSTRPLGHAVLRDTIDYPAMSNIAAVDLFAIRGVKSSLPSTVPLQFSERF
jgi:hypothetical protein